MNHWNLTTHLPKVLCLRPSVFYEFYVKPSSRYSFVHIFCWPHLPKVLRDRRFFLTFFMWNRALTKVSYTFCRPHLPKVLRTVQFFQHVEVQSEPSLQSWALFVSNFCRSRPATAKTETLLRRPRKPLYQKNAGFRARECFQAWTYAFQTCCTTWWWCVWHEDVVDMMVRMLPMTRKFSN